MIEQLKKDHVINTMIKEHEHILVMLDELEKISIDLSDYNKNKGMSLMARANELAVKVIGAEPHHKREEDVLFPAMEEKGLFGPIQCMQKEHDIMREIKHDLKNETKNSNKEWKDQVDTVSQLISELCGTLRQHIDKENNVLYPMALQFITEDRKWEEMKEKCDEIGYCCFCPLDKKELDESLQNN